MDLAKRKIAQKIKDDLREESRLRRVNFIKDELVGIVLAITGWQSLDSFVDDAIDRIISGKSVDIAQFRLDIEAWKASNLDEGV